MQVNPLPTILTFTELYVVDLNSYWVNLVWSYDRVYFMWFTEHYNITTRTPEKHTELLSFIL